MPERGTVVVVDDSPLLRTIIAETLNGVTGLRVIGQASSGREGLQMIEALDPDIVSLDIEMGDLSGIEVLESVMSTKPRKVVMVSSHTEAGADVTLKALGLGAIDFVAKGRLDPGPDGFEARLRRTFTTALHARLVGPAAGGRPVVAAPPAAPSSRTRRTSPSGRRPAPPTPASSTPASVRADRRPARPADHRPSARPAASTPPAPTRAETSSRSAQDRRADSGKPGRLTRPDLVIVASSTGGPPALQRFFESLTLRLPIPMLVVQHMPESFTARLAARLNEAGPNEVREAADGDRLEPGLALLAAGGHHLEVVNDIVRLNDSPAVGGLRPRADLTFESAIATRGGRILGIVMTGMGDDGLDGGRRLIEAGGALIAQDQESCTVDGMPRQVREAGLVSETGTPEGLAQILQRLAGGRASVGAERTGAQR